MIPSEITDIQPPFENSHDADDLWVQLGFIAVPALSWCMGYAMSWGELGIAMMSFFIGLLSFLSQQRQFDPKNSLVLGLKNFLNIKYTRFNIQSLLASPWIAWSIFFAADYCRWMLLGIASVFMLYIVYFYRQQSIEARSKLLLNIFLMVLLFFVGVLVLEDWYVMYALMDYHVDGHILGIHIPSEWFDKINAILGLILGIVLYKLFYASTYFKKINLVTKWLFAFGFLCFTHGIIMLYAYHYVSAATMPLWIVTGTITGIYVADVFIYTFALSLCLKASPSNTQGLMLSGIALSVALANWVVNALDIHSKYPIIKSLDIFENYTIAFNHLFIGSIVVFLLAILLTRKLKNYTII